MASRVAGSSHESGRCTVRLSTTTSSSAGSSASACCSTSSIDADGLASPSTCTCSERMPGVTSTMSSAVSAAPTHAASACARSRRSKSSTIGPYSTSTARSPLRAVGDLRRVTHGRSDGEHAVGRRVGASALRRARPGSSRAASVVARTRHEAHVVAGRELAELPPLVGRDRDRAHEAAEAGTVGPEQDRHVAGEVDRTHGVGRVVDVRRVQPGFAAVGPCPLGARADEAHAGARRVVVHLSSRRRRTSADAALGEEVGRAVWAVDDRELPGAGELGR